MRACSEGSRQLRILSYLLRTSIADIATELECQHRGGTCEFFVHCWLTGGLLQGTCIGLLRGCCHRTAKSANILTADYAGNTIDLTDLPQKNFGPVKNDPSEFLFQIHARLTEPIDTSISELPFYNFFSLLIVAVGFLL